MSKFIRKKNIDALLLFIEKMEELKASQFFNFYFNKNQQVQIKHEVKKVENNWIGRTSLTEPNEEVIKAYILPFRFFIQDNELCSLRNIVKSILPELNQEFIKEIEDFNKAREKINQFLDSPTQNKLRFTRGKKSIDFNTNRKIFETFIYGHYAHANIQNDKKEWYDFIHSHPDEGLNIIMRNHFRFEAINILLIISNFILVSSNAIKKILNKLIENNISRAKEFLKKSQLKEAEQAYQNSYYIADNFKDKEFRANLCKEISEFYSRINEIKMTQYFMQKVEDIKNSIPYLPSDFWNDDYNRKKFALPKDFELPLKKIVKEDLSKIPLIVLPIGRIDQVKRFEKIIVANSFNLTEDGEKNILKYELLMSKQGDKSFWSHHTFEFNRDQEYLLRFPFLDESGVLFITNSPKLFVEWYCSWIELKKLHEKFPKNLVLLQAYIDILIDIELERGNFQELHEGVKKMRNSNSVSFSVEGSDKVSIHFQGLNRIISVLIDILILPKIQIVFDIKDRIQSIKKHRIQPFLEECFKGLAWLSFTLNIILLTITSKENKVYDSVKNERFEQLMSICYMIKGKEFSNDFFEKFFDVLDNCIEDFLHGRFII